MTQPECRKPLFGSSDERLPYRFSGETSAATRKIPPRCRPSPALTESTTSFVESSDMRAGWKRILCGASAGATFQVLSSGMRFSIAHQLRQNARFDRTRQPHSVLHGLDPFTNGASAHYSEKSFTPSRPTTTSMTEQRRARFALSPKNAMPTIAVPTVAIPAKAA